MSIIVYLLLLFVYGVAIFDLDTFILNMVHIAEGEQSVDNLVIYDFYRFFSGVTDDESSGSTTLKLVLQVLRLLRALELTYTLRCPSGE